MPRKGEVNPSELECRCKREEIGFLDENEKRDSRVIEI
jgi:hypothetical protein